MGLRSTKKLSTAFLSFVLCIQSFVFVPLAYAEEIAISENGTDSSNEIVVVRETRSEVTQTNTAIINNNISGIINTGNNNASGNVNGETTITTGDVLAEVNIENISNISNVDVGSCCSLPNTLGMTSNGDNSSNSIDQSGLYSNRLTLNNNTNILNGISIVSNTGQNVADDNTKGGISIKTGDIKSLANIANSPVNFSRISGILGLNEELLAAIDGNGPETTNSIENNFLVSNIIFINNNSNLKNYIDWHSNTGENSVRDNSEGNVSIETGEIDFRTIIKNLLNLTEIEISCCEVLAQELPTNPEDPGDPGENKNPENPTNGQNDNKSQSTLSNLVGGPGILGLSDTSSGGVGQIIIWLGFAIIIIGSTIFANELSKVFKKIRG